MKHFFFSLALSSIAFLSNAQTAFSDYQDGKVIFEIPSSMKMFKTFQGVLEGKDNPFLGSNFTEFGIFEVVQLHPNIKNEKFEIFDSKMGAGAVIVIDDRHDMFDIILRNMEFFAHESCGKCTPCREGHIQIVNLIKKFCNYEATMNDYNSLKSLVAVVHETTLCGLGQTSPTSITSTMEFFNDEYMKRIEESMERGQANG